MGAVQARIVAVLFAALFIVAVGAAGGRRRVPPATAADEGWARPAADAPGLDWQGWRIRAVANVLQLLLLVGSG
jgi:hypothetical protein